MLTSILGARLSWHLANGWVFEPACFPSISLRSLSRKPHIDSMRTEI
jgi:hypothetical protein